MPPKEAPPFETYADSEMKTLELELDKEIDSLFAPAIGKADENAVADASAAKGSTPRKVASSEPANPAFDLDAGELELDDAIDKLFVDSRPRDASPPVSTSSGPIDAAPFTLDPDPPEDLPANSSNDAFGLDAGELELDDAIDKLFVDSRPRDASPPVSTSSGPIDTAPSTPDLSPQQDVLSATPEQPPHLDASQTTFESEIDSEIDKLFVPSHPSDSSSWFSSAGEEPSSAPAPSPPRAPGDDPLCGVEPELNIDATQIAIENEIDKLFVPFGQTESSSSSSASADTLFGAPAQRGLSLSEDEFTTEAQAAPTLESSRMRIDNAEVAALHSDFNSDISELIEQFNAAYLSLDWDFNKENLLRFIRALELLAPMASQSQDSKAVYKILEVVLKRLLDKPGAINSKLVQLIRDSQGLLAHMVLMGAEAGPNEKQRLHDLLQMFQNLRQKALAAKARRELSSGAPPEVGAQSPADIPTQPGAVSPAQALYEDQPETMEDTAPPAAPAEPFVHRADSCLIMSGGKWFALPASSVLKIVPSNRRMGRKVLKRGFATLYDFKPVFGGLKSGLLAHWSQFDLEELKSYRFQPSGFGLVGDTTTIGPLAVLASDGQTHRIIFCDALNFISDAQIADESSPEEDPLSKTKSRLMIPFFDLRGPQSSPADSAATQAEPLA